MAYNKLQAKDWDEIVTELLTFGITSEKCNEIADREGYSNAQPIYIQLERRGFDTRRFRAKKSKEVWDEIIDECKNTEFCNVENPILLQDIAKKYGVSVNTLNTHLKGENVDLSLTSGRKYKVNDNFFTVIDSEIKAYLLGFIMADGCVSKPSKKHLSPCRLTLNLSIKDRGVLELFKEFLCPDAIIKTFIPKRSYSDNPMNRVYINSTKLCSSLMEYGIAERKTGDESLPNNIPASMMRHFIRGFFDGDGDIYQRQFGKYATVGFTSNENMLAQLKDYFIENLSLSSVMTITKENRHNAQASYLKIHKAEDIEKIKKYFYEDSNYYLIRKFEKFNIA